MTNSTEASIPDDASAIYDLSIAIEFMNTALRALAIGHAPDSSHVREPLLMGFSKAREIAQPHLVAGGAR